MKTIKDIKVGDYFKLKPNGRVYVRLEYNRITRRFMYCDFDDVNRCHDAKRDKPVITDFEF